MLPPPQGRAGSVATAVSTTDHELEAFLALYLGDPRHNPPPPPPPRRVPRRQRRGHVLVLSFQGGAQGIYDPYRRSK